MYQIAYIGRWETLPETAAAICDHDTPKLEALLQGGLDLDVPIRLSEYIKLMPLEIAVFRNDVPMVHFLLEHGADPDLAQEQPLLLTAARCCGPEVVALFAGQAAKLSPKQKERAFQEVRWGKRPENIQVLEQAGITVDKFGGEAFRAAVSEGNTKLARLLLEKGADINYHKPDMVFPYASTPVTEAARSNNFPMVRWLVEQGADITLVDKYGDRPYSVAVQNKNQEMADYLKALEPEEWHNEQEKVRQLMPYKLPAKLVEYLNTVNNQQRQLNYNLRDIEKLDNRFFRAHLSYLVNLKQIDHVDPRKGIIYFYNGEECPVSKLHIRKLLGLIA